MKHRPDLLEAAGQLGELLGKENLILIGGLAGFLLGVERFTRDVDVATTLSPESIEKTLQTAGIQSKTTRGSGGDPLPWVIHLALKGIPIQILPLGPIGADARPPTTIDEFGIRLVSAQGFIRTKCYAGGTQDLADVAVLTFLYPELKAFAEEEAGKHNVSDLLRLWLKDKRLRARYEQGD